VEIHHHSSDGKFLEKNPSSTVNVVAKHSRSVWWAHTHTTTWGLESAAGKRYRGPSPLRPPESLLIGMAAGVRNKKRFQQLDA